MMYDADLRRDTQLARKLIARIRADGPLTMHEYMDACLNDAEYGYYRTRTAIGRAGDFITAPEISQVFGELIGLWCAVVWQQMGSPARVNLIELGAGRGTLLVDALRAARVLPQFREAVRVHILDQNPVLIEMQQSALAASGFDVTWHAALDALPNDAPSIWVANEFLDTVPVNQFERRNGGWVSRAVGVDAAGRLAMVLPPADWHTFADTELPSPSARSTEGFFESQDWHWRVSSGLRHGARHHALAALFIDYGYVGGAAIDTLQAVREHRAEHILTSPGEADLSCHVDFNSFAEDILTDIDGAALAIDGPTTQAEFLGRLGIMERASRLMAANPAKANALEMGVARLMAPQGMGTRFKAIGVRSAALPPLPGFVAG